MNEIGKLPHGGVTGTLGPGGLERLGAGSVGGKEGASFTQFMTNALDDVQRTQDQADQAIHKLATGELQDVHQVMVAFEQAKLSMTLLVEVRNKLVETYQEISRLPL